MYKNLYWRAGFCKGFDRQPIIGRYHSVIFLDGYEAGKAAGEALEKDKDFNQAIKGARSRAKEVEALYRRVRELEQEVSLLRGSNKADKDYLF